MAEHILDMVRLANPEAIEKYVKYHLPNDQASLQRIYKQLQQYSAEPKEAKMNKQSRRSQSLKTVTSFNNRQTVISNDKNSLQKKRTESLIRMLRDKGLKVTNNSEEQGMEVLSSRKDKIIKPLIANSKLLRSQEGEVDKLIHRYQINKNYYGQKQEEVRKGDGAVDREMGEFFQRREGVLQSLKNKTNPELYTNPKFNHIQKKLYEPEGQRTSYQKIPSAQRSLTSTIRISQSQNLLNICSSQVKTQKFKTVDPKVNIYKNLQTKLNRQEMQQDQAYNQMAGSIAKQISRQQYERYTNSYMAMMTDKIKSGSKCKLNKYHKDLIQDQKKMRNVIDFSGM